MFRVVVGQIRRQPVAFVALFFALGGGAMAANEAIKANDPIRSGDLAGSTYGAPMIRSGAVTNADLANSSLTVATDGSTLTGGGPIALGAGNGTPLAVAPGGIGTDQLAAGSVTNAKLATQSLTVSPGTGLTGGGSIALGGSGTLSVDPTAIQSRVNGTCSTGQAISAVSQDGTVSCAGTKIIAGEVNLFGTTQRGSGFTVAHTSTGHYALSFPAGTWSDGSTPALTLTALGPPAIFSVEGAASSNGATHTFIAASDGTSPIDSGFEFIAAQT